VENQKGSNFMFYIKERLVGIRETVARFPTTVFILIVLAFIAIYRIENFQWQWIDDKTLDRLTAVLAFGIPFTLCTTIFLERFFSDIKYKKVLTKTFLYTIQALTLAGFFMFIVPNTNMVPMVRLLMLAVTATLLFLFIPYWYSKDNFEIYFTRLLTRAVISGFFTVVLSLGIMAVLFAIKSLLYSNLNQKLFIETWVFGWILYAPIHFLYAFPKQDDTFEPEQYNKVLKILLMYIVMPIICIYTLVLYIYFAKIIATHTWPKGIVTYLVVSYSAVSTATIFLVTPFRNLHKWPKHFMYWLTKLIFPLLAMMYISIFIRINDYGFTENRCFIIAIAVWTTTVFVYMNFNNFRRNIFLFVSLAVIAFLTVVGPLSAFNISEQSQKKRLVKIFNRYDIVQNNQITMPKQQIEQKDKVEITEILRYFITTDRKEKLAFLPKDFELSKMKTIFGFEATYSERMPYDESYSKTDSPLKSFNVNSGKRSLSNIEGFQLFIHYNKYESFNYHSSEFTKETSLHGNKIKLKITNDFIATITKNENPIITFDLKDSVKSFIDKYGAIDSQGMDEDDLSFPVENEHVKAKLIFNNMNGTVNKKDGNVEVSSIECDILITIKN